MKSDAQPAVDWDDGMECIGDCMWGGRAERRADTSYAPGENALLEGAEKKRAASESGPMIGCVRNV